MLAPFDNPAATAGGASSSAADTAAAAAPNDAINKHGFTWHRDRISHAAMEAVLKELEALRKQVARHALIRPQ